MARQNLPRPTDAELAILNVLWQRGPSTVREVQAEINRERPSGYTTVLKFLQIMTEKGLVVRDESQRTHVYRPQISQGDTQRQLVGDLLDRAFGGSSQKLVMQALSARKASPEQLDQIRKLLDNLERGSRPTGRPHRGAAEHAEGSSQQHQLQSAHGRAFRPAVAVFPTH